MMNTSQFDGIIWVDITELGISQLYLSHDKLNKIQKWFDPNNLSNFQPLPVHDFGNGRLTLTDGHSRAFSAYAAGLKRIPVVYDTDDIITCNTGQILYRNDIIWCERFGLHSVADLGCRILPADQYELLWHQRCDAGYVLLTQTTPEQRQSWESLRSDLYLYGANEDLSILYFEDAVGNSIAYPIK